MRPRRRMIALPSLSIDGGLLLFLLLYLLGCFPAGSAQPAPGVPDASQNDDKFDPTMSVLMIILVSLFFVLGFFSVYIRRCLERVLGINDGRSVEPGNWGALRAPAAGLDASIIETFPTFRYSTVKTLRFGKEALECPVCLNEFHDDETLRLIPRCCHVFHPACIDAWLQSHATCPLCRANLIPVPGESVSLDIPDPSTDPAEESGRSTPEGRTGDRRRVLGSPDARLIDSVPWTTHSMPRKSMSTGWRLAGLFGRSDSTGTTPVNLERFTLRLPQEVHDQLVSSSHVEKSHVALPQARSPTSGFRTGSLGSERNYFYYERFEESGRLDRRPFSITPPYRTGSIRSPGGASDDQVRAGAPNGVFLAMLSPLDRLFRGKNNVGDRSTDHLRSGDQSPA